MTDTMDWLPLSIASTMIMAFPADIGVRVNIVPLALALSTSGMSDVAE